MTTNQKLRWVSLLYFVQRMPFGIFADTLPVYLRLHGVWLRDIGAIRLLQLPRTFKVLWSPWVDRLGTAAELALLTRLCDRDHAATQFAALTALFGLTRALAGTASGFGVESWGFASYFAFTFLLAFPAYAFLPAVRRRLQAAN